MCRMSWKSGSLNLLEPSGPHRACYGTPLHLPYTVILLYEQDLLSFPVMTLSRLCYMELTDMMTCELGRIWKEEAKAVTSRKASVRITGYGAIMNPGSLNMRQKWHPLYRHTVIYLLHNVGRNVQNVIWLYCLLIWRCSYISQIQWMLRNILMKTLLYLLKLKSLYHLLE